MTEVRSFSWPTHWVFDDEWPKARRVDIERVYSSEWPSLPEDWPEPDGEQP